MVPQLMIIEKETEKAYFVASTVTNVTRRFWIPKSVCKAEYNYNISVNEYSGEVTSNNIVIEVSDWWYHKNQNLFC